MSKQDKIWIAGSFGVTAIVLAAVFFTASARKGTPSETSASWNQGRITAAYLGSQLKEIDKSHSSLVISYDVENDGGTDYRLTEGSGVVILSRLKTDGSLSQEQPLKLGYPVFLPPGQHARLAVEMTQPFAWPSEDDPAYSEKLKGFVKHRLDNVAEFIVFDETNHNQLHLPSAWGELQGVATAGS